MIAHHEDEHDSLDRRLDRLADGELDGVERRELLLRLDVEPDGWRRCALALLETQVLRCELRDLTDGEVAAAQPRSITHISTSGQARPVPRAIRTLATTVLILVAFGLGWLLRGPSSADQPIAAGIVDPAVEPTRTTLVEHDAPPRNVSRDEGNVPEVAEPPVAVVGLLSWMVGEPDEAREVQFPVLAGPGINEDWVRRQPSAVPVETVQALERLGHKVTSDRQLLNVALVDGRRVVVPVDQLQVHFAGRVPQ